MTVFWWIVGILLLISGGTAAVGFVLYITSGNDRFQNIAKAGWHWTLVFGLGAFNIFIFKHVLGTLWEMWRH